MRSRQFVFDVPEEGVFGIEPLVQAVPADRTGLDAASILPDDQGQMEPLCLAGEGRNPDEAASVLAEGTDSMGLRGVEVGKIFLGENGTLRLAFDFTGAKVDLTDAVSAWFKGFCHGDSPRVEALILSNSSLKYSELWNALSGIVHVFEFRKPVGAIPTGDRSTRPVGNTQANDVREALAALEEEIQRARTKFPGSDRLLAALLEEVGELADELVQNRVDMTRMRMEALQVACVAIRIAEELHFVTPRERDLAATASSLGLSSRDYLEQMAAHESSLGSIVEDSQC